MSDQVDALAGDPRWKRRWYEVDGNDVGNDVGDKIAKRVAKFVERKQVLKRKPVQQQERRQRLPPATDSTQQDAFRVFEEGGGWSGSYPGAVLVRFNLRNIASIDVVEGTFRVDGNLVIDYFDPTWNPAVGTQGMPRLTPTLRVRNSFDGEDVILRRITDSSTRVVTIPAQTQDGRSHGAFVEVITYHVGLKLIVGYDLRDYPIDVAELPIDVALIPDALFDFLLPVVGFVNQLSPILFDEWQLLEPKLDVVVLSKFRPELLIRFFVARKYEWHLVNHAGTAVLITTLGLLTYSLPRDELGDRMGATFTLLLALAGSKFGLASSLPRIAYNTKLDLFYICCLWLIFLIAAGQSFVVKWPFDREKVRRRVDARILCSLIAVWLVVLLCFLSWIVVRTHYIPTQYGRPWKPTQFR